MVSIKNFLDKRLSKKLVNRLYSLPKEEWLHIAHEFNGWRFPRKFYDLIPKWWIKKGVGLRGAEIVRELMQIVDKEFGHKESLRFHNADMSYKEFNYWYDNISSINDNGKSSIKYHYRKTEIEKIEWWKDDVFNTLVDVGLVQEQEIFIY